MTFEEIDLLVAAERRPAMGARRRRRGDPPRDTADLEQD